MVIRNGFHNIDNDGDGKHVVDSDNDGDKKTGD